jgi:hypothetical protein
MRIGRLRVRGAAENSSLRLGLSAMLDRADLRPPAMPPATVLIVRRMSDPLPERLIARRIVGTADASWERAVRDRLAGLFRGAACPGRGPVPADAEAVAFADEGELLASLALDLAEGSMAGRWWWQSLAGSFSRSYSSPSPLARLLCDRALSVPAALSRLAHSRRAAQVLLGITMSEARAVLRAVCAAHRFPDPTDAPPLERGPTGFRMKNEPERSAVGAGVGPGIAAPPADEARRAARTPASGGSHVVAPWAAWMPPGADGPGIGGERLCLLGVAVTLHAAPGAARSQSFGAAMYHWRVAQDIEPDRAVATSSPARSNHVPRAEAPATVAAAAKPPAETDVTTPVRQEVAARAALLAGEAMPGAAAGAPPPATPRPDISPTSEGSEPAPASFTVPEKPVLRPVADPLATASMHDTAAEADDVPVRDREPETPSLDERIAKSTETLEVEPPSEDPGAVPLGEQFTSELMLEDGIETSLGGVLYLINVMLALDLPECFEADWQLASRLGHWGMLEALGRALLSCATEEDCADPIWAALAALAGREPSARLGEGLPYRAPYDPPSDWPKPPSPTARSRALTRSPLLGCIAPALGRWLACAIPAIRYRLETALASDADETDARGPIAALLHKRGRLHITLTHVDLVLPLDAVSVAVRLAGLDRDPGWLPTFGRVVLFHFD